MTRCTSWAVVLAAGLGAGCTPVPPPPAPTPASPAPDPGPTEIELSDFVATYEAPDRVRMEIKYRFVKGRPDRFYSLQLRFPGTKNGGVRMMDAWEMKPEGVIRDWFTMHHGRPATAEAVMAEAVSPQNGYTPASNVVTTAVK